MEDVMFVLELIGAAAFAVSGAMVAIEKKADIFGVLFLAVTTALGGVVVRGRRQPGVANERNTAGDVC